MLELRLGGLVAEKPPIIAAPAASVISHRGKIQFQARFRGNNRITTAVPLSFVQHAGLPRVGGPDCVFPGFDYDVTHEHPQLPSRTRHWLQAGMCLKAGASACRAHMACAGISPIPTSPLAAGARCARYLHAEGSLATSPAEVPVCTISQLKTSERENYAVFSRWPYGHQLPTWWCCPVPSHATQHCSRRR